MFYNPINSVLTELLTAGVVNCCLNFPLTLFKKMRSLTNGNFKKTENTVNETNLRSFLPSKTKGDFIITLTKRL